MDWPELVAIAVLWLISIAAVGLLAFAAGYIRAFKAGLKLASGAAETFKGMAKGVGGSGPGHLNLMDLAGMVMQNPGLLKGLLGSLFGGGKGGG